MTDTFRKVIDCDNCELTEPQILDGTGVSDIVKASAKNGTVIANQTFTGAPSENDVDMVRGSNAIIGPNDHSRSRPGVANHTVKGGFRNLHFCGNFGTAELGQYSIYDKWFALPPTSGITFAPDAVGHCTLWRAEMPKIVPPGVTIKRMNPFVVATYFVFRSVVQTITGK